jgi:hypothetical protein
LAPVERPSGTWAVQATSQWKKRSVEMPCRYSGTVRVRLTQPRRSSQARRGQGLAKEEAALAEAKAALAKEEAALAEAKAALAKVEAALAKEEAAAHGDGHGSRNLGQEWPVQPRFS